MEVRCVTVATRRPSVALEDQALKDGVTETALTGEFTGGEVKGHARVIPAALLALIASFNAWSQLATFQLLLLATTFTPWFTFMSVMYSIHSIASDVYPVPFEAIDFRTMIWKSQTTPATPMPSFPTAQNVPAEWVRCPLSSSGSPVLTTALYP